MTMQRFDRLLTKIPEHTWGEDTTWYLSSFLGNRSYPLGDYMNWTNNQFQKALNSPEYKMAIESWLDQRNYLYSAMNILHNSTNNIYNKLASTIENALNIIKPSIPLLNEYEKVSGTPLQQVKDNVFHCKGWTIGFNVDMSINRIRKGDPSNEQPNHLKENKENTLLGLDQVNIGLYTYQTLNPNDFEKFDHDYGMAYCTPETEDAGCHNFNKPNMTSANPAHTETNPILKQLWIKRDDDNNSDTCQFQLQGTMPSLLSTKYGAPKEIWTSLSIHTSSVLKDGISLSFDIQWFNKSATRLAEAQWITFSPNVMNPMNGWKLRGFRTELHNSKADIGIDPSMIVKHGATHLHSLGPFATIEYSENSENEKTVILQSLDSPIVSFGLVSPFPTPGNNSKHEIDPSNGMHYNIQNNIWNVNFPQWYPFVKEDKDARFRFIIDLA